MSKHLTTLSDDWLELDEFNAWLKKESIQKQQGALSANTLLTFQIWEKVL